MSTIDQHRSETVFRPNTDVLTTEQRHQPRLPAQSLLWDYLNFVSHFRYLFCMSICIRYTLLSTWCNLVDCTEALSACHYIPEVRSKVFNILYRALNSENMELQQASHECMKRVGALLYLSRESVGVGKGSCPLRERSDPFHDVQKMRSGDV